MSAPLPWQSPGKMHFGPSDPLPVDPVTDWMLDELEKMRRADTPPPEWYSLTWTASEELPSDDCFKPERFLSEEALCALFTAKNLREGAAR